MALEVYVLNCRRCDSEALLELVRLDGQDHTVYRCRNCGFLFSPPDGVAQSTGGCHYAHTLSNMETICRDEQDERDVQDGDGLAWSSMRSCQSRRRGVT